MRKIVLAILILVASVHLSTACGTVAEKFFESDSVTRYANVGVLVVDLTTGKTIDSYRANNLLPTASTMKTISTATGLELLGGDFQWSTYLETNGKVADGILYGNLYIRGTGDPTLGSSEIGDSLFLQKWVAAIQSAGIRQINGAIVADLSAFDNGEASNPGWTWDDMGNYYGMGVYSINYKENVLDVRLSSGKLGSKVEVLSTNPEVPGLEFESYARTADITWDGTYLHGPAFSEKRIMTGQLPANKGTYTIHGDIPNPGLLLAQHFTEALRAANVSVAEEASFLLTIDEQPTRNILYEHKSPALRDVVYLTNIHSNNLFAECIFRTLGLQKGWPSTLDNSRQVVKECWAERGVDMSAMKQWDGSGLAPQNAVSPAIFVDLMRYMFTSSTRRDFYASLPVSGKSGTGKYFLQNSALKGRVAAKSGTISGLKSYTGYINMPNGHVWAFSVVVNNGAGSSTVVKKCIERYLLMVTR